MQPVSKIIAYCLNEILLDFTFLSKISVPNCKYTYRTFPPVKGLCSQRMRRFRWNGQAMYGDILFGYCIRLLGSPPSPGLAAFASSRTRLTAWLFRSLRSLLPAHPRRKGNTLSGRFLIPYRSIKNQNIHLAVLAFYQITVNIKIFKTEASNIFFK